jgi:hypothetical protein
MRSKPVFAMVAAAIGLLLIARGCSERKDSAAATEVKTADDAAIGDKTQPAEFFLSSKDEEGFDLPEREEIRQKRKLTPGTEVFVVGTDDARVDTSSTYAFIIGINGKVKVETADSETAEVLVVRSARNRADLQRQKVEISNDECLFIRIGGAGASDPVPEIRQRVVLRLPRKANLEIREIGGDVTAGEIGGHLDIVEVTGKVRATSAAGPIVIGNVNGDVDITFAPFTTSSVKIGGDINGNVDLRFEGKANADLNAWSVNGAIKPDFPNVEVREGGSGWGRLKARIGNGGLGIEINDINGNVTLR